MSLTLAPLLMHDEEVPVGVRNALREAYAASPENRRDKLESAARILHAETGLECPDVRELVGLPLDCGCT